MNTKRHVKRVIKSAFNFLGLELTWAQRSPRHTLCGLKSLPINTIIDVGANNGQFARYISTIFPKAQLCCFEPLPQSYDALQTWATSQKGRVLTFNMAIGDEEGRVDMFYHTDHSSSSSLLSSTAICEKYYPITKAQKSISVKLSTLDKALSGLANISQDTLIKLDVQGYEDRVLRGGENAFNKAIACVLEVCLDRLYEDQADFKDLFLLLDEMRFQYAGNLEQVYAKDGHVVYFDMVFVKRNKGFLTKSEA